MQFSYSKLKFVTATLSVSAPLETKSARGSLVRGSSRTKLRESSQTQKRRDSRVVSVPPLGSSDDFAFNSTAATSELSQFTEIPHISEADEQILKSGHPIPVDIHDRMLRARTGQLTMLFQQKLKQQANVLRAAEDERERRHRDALDELNRAWEERYDAAIRRIAALRDAARRALVAETKLGQLAGELERTQDALAESAMELQQAMQQAVQAEQAAESNAIARELLSRAELREKQAQISLLERELSNLRVLQSSGSFVEGSTAEYIDGRLVQQSRALNSDGIPLSQEELLRLAAEANVTADRFVNMAVQCEPERGVDRKLQAGPSRVSDNMDSMEQRVRTAAALALKIEEALELDSVCTLCLRVFEKPVLLIPCGHTVCRCCADPTDSGSVVCTECGDREPRRLVQNRVADALAARYAMRSSHIGELKFVLLELSKIR